MRKSFAFTISLLTAIACLLSCSSVRTRDEIAKARSGADKAYQNLSARVDSQHFCILGLRAAMDGTVLHVGARAEQTGILPGDKIAAIDGAPIKDWSEGKEKLRKHGPNDTVTLLLLRDGSEILVGCSCLDLADTTAAAAEAMRKAANGNWLGCAETMEQMQDEYGPSPTAQNILIDCYKYHLLSQGKEADAAFASALVRLIELKIEDAAASREAMEKLKDDIRSQVAWLKHNHFPQEAEKIEAKYNAALAALGTLPLQ